MNRKMLLGGLSLCLLAFLQACYDPDYSCPPLKLGEMKGAFKSTGPDTLSMNQTKWYTLTFFNPILKGRTLVYDRLPYAPTLLLRINAISDTVVPWPTYTSVYHLPLDYTAYRPFFVRGVPGDVRYLNNNAIEIDGVLSGDSVIYSFGLEAKQKGVFRLVLSNEWFYGMVDIDSKTEYCDFYWKLNPEFEGIQDTTAFVAAFPLLTNPFSTRNRYLCVTD